MIKKVEAPRGHLLTFTPGGGQSKYHITAVFAEKSLCGKPITRRDSVLSNGAGRNGEHLCDTCLRLAGLDTERVETDEALQQLKDND